MGLWLLDVHERTGWLTSLSPSQLLELGLLFFRNEHETLYLQAKTHSLLTKMTQLSHRILNSLLICSTQSHRRKRAVSISQLVKVYYSLQKAFHPRFKLSYIFYGLYTFSVILWVGIYACSWFEGVGVHHVGVHVYMYIQKPEIILNGLIFIHQCFLKKACSFLTGSSRKLGQLASKPRGFAHPLQRHSYAWLLAITVPGGLNSDPQAHKANT